MKEDELVYDASPGELERLIRSNVCWFDDTKKAHAETEALKLQLSRANAEIARLTSLVARARVCPGRGLVGTGGVSL